MWHPTRKTLTVAAACVFVLATILTEGCASSDKGRMTEEAPATQTAEHETSNGRGRTQLWAQNCMRCHNARSPSYYSDAEWTVATHHMRIRAYMTAEEYESILQFLKAAN